MATSFYINLLVPFYKVKALLPIAIMLLTATIILLLLYQPLILHNNPITNNSGLTALLLAVIVVILHRLIAQQYYTGMQKWLLLLALLFYTVVIIYLQSRMALIALAAGTAYNYYNSGFGIKKGLLWFLVLPLVIITTLLFWLKPASTTGRWFIFKNCVQLLQQHGLHGVGQHRFNPAYNHQQAAYFSQHSLTNKTALLADNGYYAFNEWLQLWIEHGLAAFATGCAVTILLVYIIIQLRDKKAGYYSVVLIVLIIASAFSYPLQLPIFRYLGLFCGIGLIFSYVRVKKPTYTHNLMLLQCLLQTCCIILFTIRLVADVKYRATINRVTELTAIGYNNEAYGLLQGIDKPTLVKKYGTAVYLENLYKTGRLKQLINQGGSLHKHNCSHKIHTIMAKTYDETGNYTKAEENYLTALHIKPHLLESRYNLALFYLKQKHTTKARYWLQQIIVIPMKITTVEGTYIKQQARLLLNKI